MKHSFSALILAIWALFLAGCETTATNRAGSNTQFDHASPTGILVFSTETDRAESASHRTTQLTALLYDPIGRCALDVQDDQRDSIRVVFDHPGYLGIDTREKIAWHVHEVLPGEYVVTEMQNISSRTSGTTTYNTTTHVQTAGGGPAFTVRAGSITYAGDFSITRGRSGSFRYRGHNPEAARTALDEYSEIEGEIEVVTPHYVPLSCVPARGARSGDQPPVEKPNTN